MANNNVIEKTNNLDKTIPVEPIGYLYTNETQAHQFIISCTRKGEKVRLTGSVTARFVTSQNTYFVVHGSIVDGNAVITLHQDCYSIPGRFDLAIFVTSGTETTVVYAAVGTVKKTDSEEGVITGEPLPTLDELLAVVRDAQQIVSDFDDIILVQDTQPTSETNRIWVQPQADEYQVPTYEEFENLKSAFSNLNVSNALAIFEQGGIRANNGTTIGSNATIRTGDYVNSACLEVIANSGYKFAVLYYNLDGTYYGCVQNDGTIAAVSNTKWFTTSYGLTDKNYKYKIAVKRTDDGNLTTAEYTGVGFVFLTGKTLTEDWKAADSKAVGDRFAVDEALISTKLTAGGIAYGEGTRTFSDNTLTYPNSNVIATAENNSYATYSYQVIGEASFKVTGATRGASNYLAIGADGNGNVLQTVAQGTASVTTPYTDYEFTINAAGVAVVYICLYKTQSLTPSVKIAMQTTEYDKQQDTDIATAIQLGNRWTGKKIVTFGDSRTWFDGETYGSTTKQEWQGRTCVGYQQTMAKLLGATIIKQGFSGYTSAQICEKIRSYNFTGIDAVLLEGGVNDFVKASQVTIGEIAPIGSTFDTTTVYGAWQSAIEYIETNYPSVRIYMTIPAIAWLGSNDDVFPYNVAKIKGEIAELYNIPCKNLYKEGGINSVNRDYYYVDDTTETNNWHLHFNDYGNALIGAEIAQFMNVN